MQFDEWQEKRRQQKCIHCGASAIEVKLQKAEESEGLECRDAGSCEKRVQRNFQERVQKSKPPIKGAVEVGASGRTWKCKHCSFEAQSPMELRAHNTKMGHPRKPPKAADNGKHEHEEEVDQEQEVVDDGDDPECVLLTTCIRAFVNAGTDREADFRVLEYLAQRYGPLAYANEPDGITAS